jgi:hypothetical protein
MAIYLNVDRQDWKVGAGEKVHRDRTVWDRRPYRRHFIDFDRDERLIHSLVQKSRVEFLAAILNFFFSPVTTIDFQIALKFHVQAPNGPELYSQDG